MSPVLEAIVVVAVPVGSIGVSVLLFLHDWAKDKWRKRFLEQLKAAVRHKSLTYADLQHLAERWGQDRQVVLRSLRVLLSEAVAGEDQSRADSSNFIRQLLIEHQSREPYAELPENVSLQLAAMQLALPAQPETVPQLAASLSDLYSKNQRDLLRQKRLAVWGFAIGVLGLLSSVPGFLAFIRS